MPVNTTLTFTKYSCIYLYRLVQTRYGEVRGQLSILRELTELGGNGGNYRGVSYRRLSSDETAIDTGSMPEETAPFDGPTRDRVIYVDCKSTLHS